ncbi:MAG: tetratricopeptide repeat protein, partial [Planctomycetota bacterium]
MVCGHRHCTAARLGRSDLAISEVLKELGKSPEDASLHAFLSIQLTKQERYERAIESAEHALGLDPECINAYYAASFAYFVRDEDDDELAEKILRAGLQVDPTDEDLLSLLIDIRLSLEWCELALETAEHGLSLHPGSSDLRVGRAAALRDLDADPEVLLEASKLALEKVPTDPTALICLFHAQSELEDWEAAESTMQSALLANPDSADVLFVAAHYYADQYQHDRAIALAQGALEQLPGNASMSLLIIGTQILKGEWKLAEEAIESIDL